MKKYFKVSFLALFVFGIFIISPSLIDAQYVNGVWVSSEPYYIGPAPSYPLYLAPGVELLSGYDPATINPDALKTLEDIYATQGKYLVPIPSIPYARGYAVVPNGWTPPTPPICPPEDIYNWQTGELCPGKTAPTPIAVDIKANGSNGPVILSSGQSFTLSWTPPATAAVGGCYIDGPNGKTNVNPTGSVTYSPSDAVYPTSSSTFTLMCFLVGSNGLLTTTGVSDSVTVSIGTGTTTPPPTTGALIDIKANSSDGPITLTAGQALNLWWTSTRTGPCTLSSTSNPTGSSVTPTSSVTYSPGTLLYPTVTTTYTISCY